MKISLLLLMEKEISRDSLKAVKEKDARLFEFLVGTEFKFEGMTLTITLGKSKGFMVVKEDVLLSVCKDFYSKPVTLVIE